MDETSKSVLEKIGIHLEESEILIEREVFLDITKYNSVKEKIPELRKTFSSSSLTCLQQTANSSQRWPLLNLVRQILNVYGYQMKPIRKSDGYTLDGIKKFKRFFLIAKKKENGQTTIFQ